jgi:hypothetical protein
MGAPLFGTGKSPKTKSEMALCRMIAQKLVAAQASVKGVKGGAEITPLFTNSVRLTIRVRHHD